MKKGKKFKSFSVGIIFLLTITNLDAQISSTTIGGLWNDPLTWNGNVIPAANDNVVINGPVGVTYGAAYNDIIISQIGTLENAYSTNATLEVNGDITNNGVIRTHPDGIGFHIHISGDINNNGQMTIISLLALKISRFL